MLSVIGLCLTVGLCRSNRLSQGGLIGTDGAPDYIAQSAMQKLTGCLMVQVKGEFATFRFFRPQAKCVHLAGDFNGWKENELAMVRTRDGYWYACVRLPEGNYRFRYCADGQWFTDYAAFGIEHGPYGLDSVVRVVELPPASPCDPQVA